MKKNIKFKFNLHFQWPFSYILIWPFTPDLGILAASGTIKGILSILQVTHILKDNSGTYIILFAISNTFFYFMPVVLGASASLGRKFQEP